MASFRYRMSTTRIARAVLGLKNNVHLCRRCKIAPAPGWPAESEISIVTHRSPCIQDAMRQMPDVDDIEPEGENAVRYLTPRERDCLALVNAHLTSKEIAAKLNLSPFTVNQHIASAMKRLQVAGRRQAAEMYAEYLRETQAKVPFDQRFGGQVISFRDTTSEPLGIAAESRLQLDGPHTNGAADDTPRIRGSFDVTHERARPSDAAVYLGDARVSADGHAGHVPQSLDGRTDHFGASEDVSLLAPGSRPAPYPGSGLRADGRILPTLSPINTLPVTTRILFIVSGVVVVSLIFGLLGITVQVVGL